MSDQRAIAPYKFVCACCGKRSSTRYGIHGERDRGWDESCMLHAVLCSEKENRFTVVNEPVLGVHVEDV